MKFRPTWVRLLPIVVGYIGLAALHLLNGEAATLFYALILAGYVLELWGKTPRSRK